MIDKSTKLTINQTITTKPKPQLTTTQKSMFYYSRSPPDCNKNIRLKKNELHSITKYDTHRLQSTQQNQKKTNPGRFHIYNSVYKHKWSPISVSFFKKNQDVESKPKRNTIHFLRIIMRITLIDLRYQNSNQDDLDTVLNPRVSA